MGWDGGRGGTILVGWGEGGGGTIYYVWFVFYLKSSKDMGDIIVYLLSHATETHNKLNPLPGGMF